MKGLPTMHAEPSISTQTETNPRTCDRSFMSKPMSDLELIRKIARQRDQQAFQEIYTRYAKSSFNLAMYFLRDAQLAEDVAQESLSRVWISAASFDTGSVRSWILCIVAREATQKSRRRYRKHEMSNLDHASAKASNEHAPDKNLEHVELVRFLRDRMRNLSDQDRNLLGMYYGAGLSQTIIAKELSMPQRTVSFKLKKLLDELRTHLVNVGVASAVPAIEAKHLFEAMTTGQFHTSGLSENALNLITSERLKSLPNSTAHHAGRGTSMAVAMACIAILGGIAFVWTMKQPHTLSAGTKDKPSTVNVSKTSSTPIGSTHSTSHLWNFDKKPHALEMMMSGKWTWGISEAIRKGVLGTISTDQQFSYLALPMNPPEEPFLVTLEFKSFGARDGFRDALWGNKDALTPGIVHYFKGRKKIVIESKKKIYKSHFYFWGRWVAMRHENKPGKIHHVTEYSASSERNSVILCLNNIFILSITLSPLPTDQFPFNATQIVNRIGKLKGHKSIISATPLNLQPFKDHNP